MSKTSQKFDTSRKEEILGILLITFGLLVLLSLLTSQPEEQPESIRMGEIRNQLGVAGVYMAYYLIQFGLGYASIAVPMVILMLGWTVFRGQSFSKWPGVLLLVAFYTSVVLGLAQVAGDGAEADFSKCGFVGWMAARLLLHYLGKWGSILLLLALFMITVVGSTNFSFSGTLAAIGAAFSAGVENLRLKMDGWRNRRSASKRRRQAMHGEEPEDWQPPSKPRINMEARGAPQEPNRPVEMPIKPAEEPNEAKSVHPPESQPSPPAGAYHFPPHELLGDVAEGGRSMSEEELVANGRLLEERLLEFGVEGKVTEINPGPVITRYEIEPAPGVKVSRITALADDLALAMRARSIRIVAPIPGKGAVGIEIPNRDPSVVLLRDIIDSPQFQSSDSPLTLALGKTISGKPFVTRLDQMPHLLIAGATGSGKSVCLNSIIASILYKAHPTEVNFVMIDPKRLELSVYNNLRHHHLTYRDDLNEEVVTKAANAISVLKSMERVMEDRYEILARAGVRNVSDYNRKLKAGQLKNLDEEEPFEPLPFLVMIVDELADLMLTAARDVEEPIARLTQMSRAVGIHLILATQRPSVDVITGIIKANFPARIAFQVASKTDSRTILDANGAEKLLGHGDMLFMPAGSPSPIRLHGAYVSSEEIERIIAHIRKQPRYPKRLLPMPEDEGSGYLDEGALGGKRDPLFNEAMKLVVRHQQGSISLLQRRLKIGYARAARIIDELEAAGVVGGFDGSKAREVLIDEEQLEDLLQFES